MADDKMVPVEVKEEMVRELVEMTRRGEIRGGYAMEALAQPKRLTPLSVNPEGGVAQFTIDGSLLSEMHEWTDGLRLIREMLERNPDVVVHFCAHVYTPDFTAVNGERFFMCTLDEMLESGENGILVEPIGITIYGKGCPLPPGLVPRLLKAAEVMTKNVGEEKEADTNAEGNPLGASLYLDNYLWIWYFI